jgi:hypothetical protein
MNRKFLDSIRTDLVRPTLRSQVPRDSRTRTPARTHACTLARPRTRTHGEIGLAQVEGQLAEESSVHSRATVADACKKMAATKSSACLVIDGERQAPAEPLPARAADSIAYSTNNRSGLCDCACVHASVCTLGWVWT